MTVEDILEELVGDIMDEHDKEEPGVQELAPGVFVVDAQMWVEDINERMDLDLPTDEAYETIGGLIIDRLGHLPQHPGEKVEIGRGRRDARGHADARAAHREGEDRCPPSGRERRQRTVKPELREMSGMKKRIAVLASGQGFELPGCDRCYRAGKVPATCVALITDNPKAYAIERAEKAQVPVRVIDYALVS